MHITCQRKDLLEAVQFVSQGVSTRSTLPILSNLLLAAREDEIALMACDLEMWVERTLPSIAGERVATTIPARLFLEVMSALTGEEVQIRVGDRYDSEVASGSSRFTIAGLNAEEFPPMPALEGEEELALPLGMLKEMVNQVGVAVAKDETRPSLTGILFTCDDECIRMVATDTYRLAMRTAPKPTGANSANVSVIIPLRALDALLHTKAGPDAEVLLKFSGNRVQMLVGRDKVLATLIPGGFPAYERVVPREWVTRWTVPTEEFAAAIRRTEILAKQSSHRVLFSSEGNKLTLSARAEGYGSASEELEIVADGPDMTIAFNARYMLDALGVIGSDGVRLEMTEQGRPGVIKPAADEVPFLYVIMPMSLDTVSAWPGVRTTATQGAS